MAKEVIFWTRLKGMKTITFLFSKALNESFKLSPKRKVCTEKAVLLTARGKLQKCYEWMVPQPVKT